MTLPSLSSYANSFLAAEEDLPLDLSFLGVFAGLTLPFYSFSSAPFTFFLGNSSMISISFLAAFLLPSSTPSYLEDSSPLPAFLLLIIFLGESSFAALSSGF